MHWNYILRTLHLSLLISLYSICSVTSEKVLRTKVAILGAGMTGITAARTLHDNGVHDFLLVEARSELGDFLIYLSFNLYEVSKVLFRRSYANIYPRKWS